MKWPFKDIQGHVYGLSGRGGATGGCGGYDVPPLLWYVPRRGYNAIYVVNSHLALALVNSASCTVCYNNDTENLTYNLAS